MQSQACLDYAETKLFLCKKIFLYFCLFFSFFLYTPRRGMKRTKLFFYDYFEKLLQIYIKSEYISPSNKEFSFFIGGKIGKKSQSMVIMPWDSFLSTYNCHIIDHSFMN